MEELRMLTIYYSSIKPPSLLSLLLIISSKLSDCSLPDLELNPDRLLYSVGNYGLNSLVSSSSSVLELLYVPSIKRMYMYRQIKTTIAMPKTNRYGSIMPMSLTSTSRSLTYIGSCVPRGWVSLLFPVSFKSGFLNYCDFNIL